MLELAVEGALRNAQILGGVLALVVVFFQRLENHLFLDSIERDLIEKALAQTRYNRTAAADLLGITFRQLRYRMQRLNIQ